MARPLLSVVIATYNRPDILPFAIRSVLLNEDIDLEVVVVGDGCNDSTRDAVMSVGDARVRYINLPQNWGEQSVPSNEGIAHAKGEYIAFLNHDDLYLPWHLADLMALHRDGVDVAWSPFITAFPARSQPADVPAYELAGVTPTKCFDPVTFVVASATCYRRDVLKHVGSWTRASRTILSPSQDLLFKAYKAGFRIERTDRPSVLALYSGGRKDSYVKPSAEEHRVWFERVERGGSALLLELLRAGVHDAARRQQVLAATSAGFFALWRLHRRAARLALRLGMHPNALRMWVKHRGRGGFINQVRQATGLPPLDFRAREKERTGPT